MHALIPAPQDPRLPSAKLELNVMTPDYFLLPRMEKFNLEAVRPQTRMQPKYLNSPKSLRLRVL